MVLLDDVVEVFTLADFDALGRFRLRRVMNDPAIDYAMINGKSTFLPQSFDVPVTDGVREIPTNALKDHVFLKMSALEGYFCHNGIP